MSVVLVGGSLCHRHQARLNRAGKRLYHGHGRVVNAIQDGLLIEDAAKCSAR